MGGKWGCVDERLGGRDAVRSVEDVVVETRLWDDRC